MLHGDNGAGKTNLLEAVYLLATLRSFRDARPGRWIRQGQPGALVEGRVRGLSGERSLCWRTFDGERQLLIDGGPGALKPWFELLSAVLFSPETVAVVRGEPEARRRLLDRAEFTARPAYLDLVRDYRRVVQQKSTLLRSGRVSASELDIWDDRLASLGASIRVRRRRLVDELRGPLQEAVTLISGGERVTLRLRDEGADADDPARVEAALREALVRARPDELRQMSALVGPHRDDLDIEVAGRSARRYASQGQARTLALALRLGELEAARRRGQSPLFLLDDLTSELDQGRRERLIAHLMSLDNQVWVTTTDRAYLGVLPAGVAQVIRVLADDLRVEPAEPAPTQD